MAAGRSPLARQLRQYRAVTLDLAGLMPALAAAPLESRRTASAVVLTLPMPDGTSGRFRLVESPIMEPALARLRPDIKTYAGVGLDDPSATVRCDLTPKGFHAQVLSASTGTVLVEPAAPGDVAHYLSFYRRNVRPEALAGGGQPSCSVGPATPAAPVALPGAGQRLARLLGQEEPTAERGTGAVVRSYRLAVAATAEYTAATGGTVAAAQASIVTTVNRVVGIYEKELAVRLMLINNTAIIYTNAATDPYTDNNSSALLTENQANLDNVIGTANYDIGHVFATGGGGLAGLGVVCRAGQKARGETGLPNPTGEVFAVDFVAHEFGHQFGGNHTFNSASGNCAGTTRNAATAYEPGSGSTIMAYAGICAPDNLQSNSDPYFHTGSYDEIQNYIDGFGACASTAATGNTAPTVTRPALGVRTLPQGTPFRLTARGADANNDPLLYSWEELDLGTASSGGAADPQAPGDKEPLFRSFSPTASPTRFFPRLASLAAGTSSLGERLPTVARTLRLRCTVRDRADAMTTGPVGGVNYTAPLALPVDATNATPFAVTVPNTAVTWAAGSAQTVSWDAVNTRTSAVGCRNVNLRLSLDGGLSYPLLLAAGVPNTDGLNSTTVTVPATATTQARVQVEAADNYFFDISNANFTVTAPPAGPTVTGLSPAAGPVGTVVTVTGTGFGTSASELSVTFNGVAATLAGPLTTTSFAVTVPTGALTGPVVITKTGAGAGTASAGQFQVSPVVLDVSPASGPVGTVVTISGNSFGGATNVSFGGGALVPASSFSATDFAASPNTITLTVPVGAATGAVVVFTAGGGSNENVTFTVEPFAVASASPAPNATAVREFALVTATFNVLANASNASSAPIKVTSLQAGGRKAGTTTVSGNAITFDPATDFRAGEVVQLTVTPAAVSGAGATLPQSYVSQFTVRTRTRTGLNAAADTPVGTAPRHSAAGDLDGDQDLDLVVSNSNGTTGTTVSVLLNNFNTAANGNNGTGSGFTAAADVTVGAGPQGLVLADLNNDQQLDLVVVSSGARRLSVFQGNGNGTFTGQTSAALGAFDVGSAAQVVVGDLNGDGNLDLAAPRLFSNIGNVVIGLGDGGFSFALSEHTGLANAVRSVALVDLNGDGRLDLVTASATASTDGTVSLRRGNGDGTFGGPAAPGSQDLPALGATYVVAADLTADGYPDVAGLRRLSTVSPTPIDIWLGSAAGTASTTPLTSNSDGQSQVLTTADHDGDGDLDLFAPQFGSASGVIGIISYNFTTGVFDRDITSTLVGTQPYSVVLADFNNDRALDFLAVNMVGTSANNVTLRLAAPAGVPLPVELVSFTAQRTGTNAVALAWRTASELRNAGFVVERSPDGQTFAAVAALSGLGTSSTGGTYAHTDQQAPASLLYYRLRQVDVGGAVKYSPVAAVAARPGAAAPAGLMVYPNPARLAAFVQLSGAAAAQVQLFDALGREVRHVVAPTPGTVGELSLRGLPAGLYVVRCGTLAQRLVIE